jgi:hypothetical protein
MLSTATEAPPTTHLTDEETDSEGNRCANGDMTAVHLNSQPTVLFAPLDTSLPLSISANQDRSGPGSPGLATCQILNPSGSSRLQGLFIHSGIRAFISLFIQYSGGREAATMYQAMF